MRGERDGRGGKLSGVGDDGRSRFADCRLFTKLDDGFADAYASAVRQSDRRDEPRVVVVSAVRRTQILQNIPVAFAPDFSVHARRERIGDAHIVARRTTDGDTQTT